MDGLMKGKRGLIMGLANDKSLAWGIAQRLKAEGAELAISYQGEVMEKRVRPLAEQLGCDFLIDCDVSDMANLDAAFAQLGARWPTIDFVVHAIGFTNKEALRGKYFDVTLDDFLMTMNISVYSFTAVAKRAAAMMVPFDPETGKGGGSMLANAFHERARKRGFTDVIHALMHETNLSAQHSGNTGGKVFRRYAMWGGRL